MSENLNTEIAEQVETPVVDEQLQQGEEISEVENDTPEFTPAQQRKIGEIVSAERKKLQAKFSQKQVEAAPVYNAQENTIYDPKTRQYVAIESTIGQIVVREQLEIECKKQDAERAFVQSRNAAREELTERLSEGYSQYNNFENALQTFGALGTDDMADALSGVDNPAAIVAYFSDKPGELKRIARLTPGRQAKEIFRTEEILSPRKKLVSSAPVPVAKIKPSSVQGVRAQDMSAAQIADHYEKKYNHR